MWVQRLNRLNVEHRGAVHHICTAKGNLRIGDAFDGDGGQADGIRPIGRSGGEKSRHWAVAVDRNGLGKTLRAVEVEKNDAYRLCLPLF